MSGEKLTSKKLVIGASGFLGSHVTRQLVERGDDVRVMLRKTSSTRGIDDLDVERVYGDVFDDQALQTAMVDCDVVYYCVVDARAWLRDPSPLFRTNVEGLRHVLDAACEANLKRFVFTSTIATLAIGDGSPVTEADPFDWHGGGPYVESRVAAENLVLQYAREKDLPAVALCISTTYGPRDWQPTPHGGLLALVAAGRWPFYFKNSMEIVGIEDAAHAMVLADHKGRIGERYIISDRMVSQRELHQVAAEAVGARPPRFGLPMKAVYAAARVNDFAARLVRKDLKFATVGIRMADVMSPLDHSKAERELGWSPKPVEESVRKAARFYREQRITGG